MSSKHYLLVLSLLCLPFAGLVSAQPDKMDRDVFAQTRARADKGDAEAQLKLASMYVAGTGVEPNLKQAARWHRKAAEQGLAAAEYQLGLDYANGTGVKPSAVEAAKWFRLAAEQGSVDAEIDLGRAYVNGRGLSPSEVEAVRWFRKAADQGSAAGKYELARSYLEGEGVAKDVEQGLKWLQPAADQGYALAENRLGQCYERGEGVAKDPVQAYKWYNLAVAQDEENAADVRLNLAKLEGSLSKDQIAEGQRLAREFKPTSLAAVKDSSPKLAGTATGSVTITSYQNSEVFVDGAFVGNSPASVKLAPGTHVIEVKRAGFKPYRRELQVTAGADLNLHVQMVQ